jgi:cystathionine beta-lyase
MSLIFYYDKISYNNYNKKLKATKVNYDFSTSACREKGNAEKYTLRRELFGTEDVEPLWVADMDIDTPSFVLEAVEKRLKHPIIGYEEVPDSAFLAQIEWMKKEHGISFELKDMLYSHSVVAFMSVMIDAFSDIGDKIIVQTPVYPPFFQIVSKIDEKTKILLLCSPHNPVGRVWNKEELENILEVCLEHNIVVFSDEIHSDLVYEPYKHIPFASLNQKARDITVTAIGVGKTFNMAGFSMSSVAIPNKNLRELFLKRYERVHFAQGSVLSHVAFESAYKNDKGWVSELKIHLQKNFKMLEELCEKYTEFIKVTPIEATYLIWLDCKGMNLNNSNLRKFFINEAKLGLNPGLSFSKDGSGFMRLNFAISSFKMIQLVNKLEKALKKYRKKIVRNKLGRVQSI